MENEIWKDVVGYEGLYQVSNFGRVKSLERKDRYGRLKGGVILKQKENRQRGEYKIVTLSKDGVQCTKRVHRIVSDAFIPNPEGKPHIDHIDTNPRNNHVSNLRWATVKENHHNPITEERYKNVPKPSEETKRKNRDSHRKYTIYMLDKETEDILNVFKSIHQACSETGINRVGISNCCRGTIHYSTAGGYKWEYLKL